MIPPILAAKAAIDVTGSVASVMTQSIKAIYKITSTLNEFVDEHIEKLKQSDIPTIARTGRVIEAAKFGFGVGYVVPVAIIAVGQLLLGNTLSAIGTVASAVTLSNPIAMTCASIGAIYYGWSALTDAERTEIIQKVSEGLSIGAELIKSILRFILDKIKELLSDENIKEIKNLVRESAQAFGRTIGDITRAFSDRATDLATVVGNKTGSAYDSIVDASGQAVDRVKEISSETVSVVKNSSDKLALKVKEKFEKN